MRIIHPLRCIIPQVSSSFRCVSTIFTILFTIIIVLIILIEINRVVSAGYEYKQWNPKFRRKGSIQHPTDITDSSLNYGIVIDCGSSGSRVFIYFWPTHSGNPKDLLRIQPLRDQHSNSVNLKIEPGISEYASTPHNASQYLDPLLLFASRHIPKERHRQTFLYILATAGMRLLPESQQAAIVRELKVDIPRRYTFTLSDVEVITGKQEGVYTWVALNYVLRKFKHGHDDQPLVAVSVHDPRTGSRMHVRRRTVGIIDMGGASMQIAYELPHAGKTGLDKSVMAEFSLGCKNSDIDHKYKVYVATFLGQGANSARHQYESTLAASNANDTLNGLSPNTAITDPCLPLDMPMLSDFDITGRRRHFIGTGDFASCRQSVLPLLNLTKSCASRPCWPSGTFQPEINFQNSELYGFSEFWYTSNDVLGIGGLYNSRKFESAAKEYCSTRWTTLLDRAQRKLYPDASPTRLHLQCFKSAWMSAVLHDGFNLPRSYSHFHAVNLIDNQPIQWTLGALLHRLRYLPLQEVEWLQLRQTQALHSPWVTMSSYFSSYIFAACIVIVMAAIVIYIRHIHSASLRQPIGLHKVPSVPYFTL